MNNYQLAYVVKTHSNHGLPAGTIVCFNLFMNDITKNKEYLLCDGSKILEEDYPDLYAILKEQYNPPFFYKDTKIRNFLRRLGFRVPRKRIKNKNYTEGEMNLPDLQDQFIGDPDLSNIENKIIRE